MNNAVVANILSALIILGTVVGGIYSMRTDQALTDLKITYIQNDIISLRNVIAQISKVVVNTNDQTPHPTPSK